MRCLPSSVRLSSLLQLSVARPVIIYRSLEFYKEVVTDDSVAALDPPRDRNVPSWGNILVQIKLEGHSVERTYLRQSCSHGSR